MVVTGTTGALVITPEFPEAVLDGVDEDGHAMTIAGFWGMYGAQIPWK
jgi:hypothetical protein